MIMFDGLAEPGGALSPDRVARYSRTISLPGFGLAAQGRLASARVLVVGAGGLGSASIPGLAAAGFGTIGIIDADTVEASNLPRQTIHGIGDVGRSKVASALETVAALDPAVRAVGYDTMLTAANALEIMSGYDLVLDGSDNFATRYLTNDAALLSGIPVVWGAVHQFGGQAGVSWAARGPHYRDLFPEPPAPGTVPSCAEAGALPPVCAVIGALMVAEAIKLVSGVGDPLLGRVTIYDSLRATFREVGYASDPEGTPVTGLIDYEAFCGTATATDADTGSGTAAPAGIAMRDIDARELSELLAAGSPLRLVDVREPWEAEVSRLPGSQLLPLGDLERDPQAAVDALQGGPPVVVYCHHGPRSDRARAILERGGLVGVRSLQGGIDDWAATIDLALRRY
ncbi:MULTISPECIES: ThiF family adenylyltransferase [Cryobacterium]|nr:MULTISPECIES: ThiF family adenylyltransferase [Cryobacterium]